jgi:hypothetical protein
MYFEGENFLKSKIFWLKKFINNSFISFKLNISLHLTDGLDKSFLLPETLLLIFFF